MEATETKPPVKSVSLPRTIIGAGLISLALYYTGFFILLPLPIFYAFRKGKIAGLGTLLLACGLLAVGYAALLNWGGEHLASPKVFDKFFSPPGIGPAASGIEFVVWALGYYLFFAVMGILLAAFERKNYSVNRVIGQVALIQISLFALLVLIATQGQLGELLTAVKAQAVTFFKAYFQLPQGNEEVQAQFKFFQEHAEELVGYAMMLMPGMIVNSILFVTWLNVVAAREILFRSLPFPSLGPLRRWRLPFGMVWAVIANAFLLIADRYLIHSEWLSWVALNVFLVFGLVYTFQGLAIVVFYAVRWSLSPFLRFWLYGLLLLMILFEPFGLILVAFGFFDSWFDFRRLTPKPTPG